LQVVAVVVMVETEVAAVVLAVFFTMHHRL